MTSYTKHETEGISQIGFQKIHVWTSIGLGRRRLTVQTSLWTRAHPKALSFPLRPPELSDLNRVRFLGAAVNLWDSEDCTRRTLTCPCQLRYIGCLYCCPLSEMH